MEFIFTPESWPEGVPYPIDMTGRVAIVTGGNSGIGYEVARHLCEGGYDTVLACRCEHKGSDAVAKLKREYPNALVECMKVRTVNLFFR